MNFISQLPATDRQAIFTETGVKLGLPPFHIEKDFWVCWTLSTLFKNELVGPNLAFRGGTSLSKGWQCIERFSEDIDLSISRNWISSELDPSEKNIASNEREKRLRKLRKECRSAITEILIPLLNSQLSTLREDVTCSLEVESLEKARDPFCIYLYYPTVGFNFPANYHRPAVKIELSGRAEGWPIESRRIQSYVTQQFSNFSDDLDLHIPCVRPERTFWEKVSLLHELNTRPERKPLAARQSRHLYDLYQLWQHLEIYKAPGFYDLFEIVKKHRQSFFAYQWVDYDKLSQRDLILHPPEDQISTWKADYAAMESMFFGKHPSFEEIRKSIRTIQSTLAIL
ncbi:MAG: nucleotidyl transferase AbiEii/AbiGii toxin family protein [Chthoniobacterales bacterium]